MPPIKQKKPNAVLFDISGTAARESFVQKTLFPYFKKAYKVYMENNWAKPECKSAIEKLAEQSENDDSAPKISFGDKISTIPQVWFDGYDRNKLKTPVYSDVAMMIQRWKCNQNLKLYVLSNGWSEATRKFMSKTSHGDLNLMIEDHFDTSMGSLTNSDTYKKVASKIGEKPSDVCFLTKSADEGMAAKKAGLGVILVLTHCQAVEEAKENCPDIPVARTFTNIEFV